MGLRISVEREAGKEEAGRFGESEGVRLWLGGLRFVVQESAAGKERKRRRQLTRTEEGRCRALLLSIGSLFSHPLHSPYCAKRGRHGGVKGLTQDKIVLCPRK